MGQALIKPTVGRVVWYHPVTSEPLNNFRREQPFAALVTMVVNERKVHLVIFDHSGVPYGRMSVTLRQPDDEEPLRPYCEWMPYQIGQAAKTEEVVMAAAAEADRVAQTGVQTRG